MAPLFLATRIAFHASSKTDVTRYAIILAVEHEGTAKRIQQVTITTTLAERAKPRLRAAIQNQVKLLEHGIDRTRARLTAFEKQFTMPSAEFLRRYQTGGIAETVETIEWRMEIEARHLLQDEYQILSEARID